MNVAIVAIGTGIGSGISQRGELIEWLRAEVKRIVSIVDVATMTPNSKQFKFHADANLIGGVYHLL